MSMALKQLIEQILPAVEEELKESIADARGAGLEDFHHMLAYHLGWEGAGAGPEARGKRIRPLLVLLSASAAGQDWRRALPAAAAVELIHNFSLIHDDIQDNSTLRRGRATLWTVWGTPLAINAGDAMFTLAHLAMLRMGRSVSPEVALQCSQVLQEACLKLTQGQHLDITYEGRGELTLEYYWPMVSGKTAALLAACCETGALAAQVDVAKRACYRQFGWSLGLAFQAHDDLLGIWGDSALTGKSAESDLLSGKKSLPVLYGLEQGGMFSQRWADGPIQPAEVSELATLLEAEGARVFTEEHANRLTLEALGALDQAQPMPEAGQALRELALMLIQRQA